MRLAASVFSICMLAASARGDGPPVSIAASLNRYCAGCHNEKLQSGGLSFTHLDAAHPERNAAKWEKVILKLRSGMMPPSGAPRPDAEGVRAIATSLEERLDQAALVSPNPGRPALHRLNRTEYANSVKDLLDLDIDAASLLPADDSSHGFDNMAEVLTVSPTLMEAYVRAAGRISRQAMGDAQMSPVIETYHLPSTLSQTRHIEGTPLGTRGGLVIRHNFPADGTYTLRMTLYFTTNTFVFGTHQKGEQLDVALNGERVALLDINPLMKVDDDLRTKPLHIKAGPQTITVAFVQKASGPVEDFVQPFEHSLGDLFLGRTQGLTGLPHLRDVGIEGPRNISGVSDMPSRKRILTCSPVTAASESGCAKTILAALARHAWRRPVTGSDLDDLLSTYQAGRGKTGHRQTDFESGIRLGLQLILASPQFVFRFERTPEHAAPGSNYRISDLELASRLSYFLWSSAPDERLLTLASEGKLSARPALDAEVRRMLADPRSENLTKNFAGQWLYLRNLQDVQPDLFAYPNFDRTLLNSMRRETELLFSSILHENRSALDLLDADYTFVDERLARHYGIPDVAGNRFRRVAVTDENRRGLLGHASILTVTSYANRTSPVVRGKWVLDNFLGAPPPQPPANIPPLKENSESAKALPVRARLEEHRKNPSCAACHTMMDPIGFALENFDAVGAWRIHDSGFPVETAGVLVDGTKLDGPASLRKALLGHSGAFLQTLTVKLLTYALGRGLQPSDMPAVRSIAQAAARDENRLPSLVLAIVNSTPFQLRRVEEDRSPTQTGIE